VKFQYLYHNIMLLDVSKYKLIKVEQKIMLLCGFFVVTV
jgi:hypothetical protein